jgi:hypothetical protein
MKKKALERRDGELGIGVHQATSLVKMANLKKG